jgi:hypothetical protein
MIMIMIMIIIVYKILKVISSYHVRASRSHCAVLCGLVLVLVLVLELCAAPSSSVSVFNLHGHCGHVG